LRRLRADAGLTLIEIIVAVSLLSLLSAGMVTALQIGADSWSDTRERMMLDRRIATANNILNAQLAGVVPILARVPPGRSVTSAPFFQGEPQAMRFVTSYSLLEGVRGGLQVVELLSRPSKNGMSLLLTHTPYRGPLSVGRFIMGSERSLDRRSRRLLFSAIRTRADTMIVADQLKTCSFSYLGEQRTPDEPPVWKPVWEDDKQIPAAVRIEMSPGGEEVRLDPVTIVAQIRARYAIPSEENWTPNLNFGEIVEGPRGPVLRRRTDVPPDPNPRPY